MRSIKNRLLLKGRKNKKTIITILLALVTMTGLAQTKTATVTGYSPALSIISQIFDNSFGSFNFIVYLCTRNAWSSHCYQST